MKGGMFCDNVVDGECCSVQKGRKGRIARRGTCGEGNPSLCLLCAERAGFTHDSYAGSADVRASSHSNVEKYTKQAQEEGFNSLWDKKRAATTADGAPKYAKRGPRTNYKKMRKILELPHMKKIYAAKKGKTACAEIVKVLKPYMRPLAAAADCGPYLKKGGEQLFKLLVRLRDSHELALAMTDVETRPGELRESAVVIVRRKGDGTSTFEVLFSEHEKRYGKGLNATQERAYHAALKQVVARGMLLVHHGGSESKIASSIGIPMAKIIDQLQIFRFALGYSHKSRPAGAPVLPLAMDVLAHLILKEKEEHKAESDCKNQALVLFCLLDAFLDHYTAEI